MSGVSCHVLDTALGRPAAGVEVYLERLSDGADAASWVALGRTLTNADGRAAGLDPAAVVEVISKGAAQSWQMENRYKTMLAGHFEHGFAVEWMRKDLGICFEEAKRNGAALPVTELVDRFYAEVEAMGGRRWDTSSLFARMEKLRQEKP